MGEDVVDADEGPVDGPGHALGEAEPDEEGADEAGPGGSRYAVELAGPDSGLFEGLIDDAADPLAVLAAGYLGDDALILLVEGNLRGDDVGEDALPVLHDGGGALVAGGLNSKDSHRPPRLLGP